MNDRSSITREHVARIGERVRVMRRTCKRWKLDEGVIGGVVRIGDAIYYSADFGHGVVAFVPAAELDA